MKEELWDKRQETLDDLVLGGLKIIQPQRGYRFSLDPVLLAHFCELKGVKTVVDLGTGNGVIPLILTTRIDTIKIIGIEIQEKMVSRAYRSVVYNNLKDKIDIVHADIKEIKDYFKGGSAELVVCNPPFWRKGEGRISSHEEEAVARHEIKVNLEEIVCAADYILTSKGRLSMVQRADRLLETVKLLEQYNLGITRMRMVHSRKDTEAKLILVEGQKNKHVNPKILPPLIIYGENDEYCSELKKIYQFDS